MRNFGIPNVTGSTANGGVQPSSPHYGADKTRADQNVIQLAGYLPPGRLNLGPLQSASLFIPADLPLPRGKFMQTMFDVLTVLVWLLLSSLLGAVCVISIFGSLLALGWWIFFH